MRIKTSVNRAGQIYIPKKMRKTIGMKLEGENAIDLIADMQGIFIIPEHLSPKDALSSLNVIAEHLKHQMEMEGNKHG